MKRKRTNIENITNMDDKIPVDFALGDNVDIRGALGKLPKNLTLGDKFDMSKLTMFSGCKLQKEFSLGEKFDTSSATNMASVFLNCEMPKGFPLS